MKPLHEDPQRLAEQLARSNVDEDPAGLNSSKVRRLLNNLPDAKILKLDQVSQPMLQEILSCWEGLDSEDEDDFTQAELGLAIHVPQDDGQK